MWIVHPSFFTSARASLAGAVKENKEGILMLTDGILTLEKIAEYAGLPLNEVKKSFAKHHRINTLHYTKYEFYYFDCKT